MANFNLNKVILGGRMTADPELKQTPQGTSVTSFSVAVNRKGKDAQTDFINCVAWRQTAEFVEKYFKKGSGIEATDHLQSGSYENKEGKKVYTLDLFVEEAGFVGSKKE